MRLFRIGIVLIIAMSQGCVQYSERRSLGERRPQQISPETLVLNQSLIFFNDVLRDPHTGQYADHYDLPRQARANYSSVGATGMGLIALSLGDESGVTADAEAKAIQTLEYLLSRRDLRHARGWFRHFFSFSPTSVGNSSEYSPIDTAILVAGAISAGNYFFQRSGRPTVINLAKRLSQSVDWDDAVPDQVVVSGHPETDREWALKNGWLLLGYDSTGQPLSYMDSSGNKRKALTQVFSEYVILPCLAKSISPVPVKLKHFWEKHLRSLAHFDRANWGGQSIIVSQNNLKPLSHFVFQFPYYLCPQLKNRSDYIQELIHVAKADKNFFAERGHSPYEWGIGAGSESNDGHTSYKVNSLGDNPNQWMSPHIIAGFIPVFPEAREDFKKFYLSKNCNVSIRYKDENLDLPWRCRRNQGAYVKAERIEAVDFATMIFGLAEQSAPIW